MASMCTHHQSIVENNKVKPSFSYLNYCYAKITKVCCSSELFKEVEDEEGEDCVLGTFNMIWNKFCLRITIFSWTWSFLWLSSDGKTSSRIVSRVFLWLENMLQSLQHFIRSKRRFSNDNITSFKLSLEFNFLYLKFH